MKFLEIFLLILNWLFFLITCFFVILDIYGFIMGSKAKKKMLEKIKFPLTHNQGVVVCTVCFVLMLIIYGIRERLF